MRRLDLLLAAVLLASCLLLVKTAYDTRRLFAAVEGAQSQARSLDAEHKRLDAERQAQGAALRVEKTAREKLQMRPAHPAVTFAVTDAGPAAAGGTR